MRTKSTAFLEEGRRVGVRGKPVEGKFAITAGIAPMSMMAQVDALFPV